MLFNSIVLSVILNGIFGPLIVKIIPEAGTSHSIPIALVASILSGYICARLVPSRVVHAVRKWLSIARTPNKNIWDDILEPGIWIRVWLKDSSKSYYGQIKFIEDYEREPIIVLEYYQFLDGDASVLIDNTSEPGRTVMLNLSQFERIELASCSVTSK